LQIKAVSFDFWQTLFTEYSDAFRFYAKRRRDLLADALTGYGTFSLIQIQEACRMEAESFDLVWRQQHRTLLVNERLGTILSHLDVCLPDDVTTEITRAYEEGLLERPPVLIPGALEAVERLSGKYRLGIISDVGFSPGRVLRQVLRDTGLIDAFDSLVFSDEAGFSKPHPEVFRQTAHTLDCQPDEMVHVGDLEHSDIVGAKRAGCRAIRFTGITPMAEEEATAADRLTASMNAVPEIIAAL
jgi:HAD superfamily hydrolase (TIGR01549 family)